MVVWHLKTTVFQAKSRQTDRDTIRERVENSMAVPSISKRVGRRELMALCLVASWMSTPAAIAQHLADTPHLAIEWKPRTVYIGQAAELTIIVNGSAREPFISTPRVDGADVTHLGSRRVLDTQGPRSVTLYQIVARKAGGFVIPPIQVVVGDWRASTSAVRFRVLSLPASGRPASFLGGVGSFDLETSLSRSSVVVGEWVEYLVEVSGPGSVGISQEPDVSHLEKLPSRFEIDRQPDRVEDDPPSRCFVYRLRPTRAGDVTLPPIPISAFDPETKRYLTRVAPSVKLRVEPLSALEASNVDYGRENSRSGDSDRHDLSRPVLMVLGVLAAVVLIGTGLAVRRVRTSPRSRFEAAIEEVVLALESTEDPVEQARTLTEGLAAYLNLAIERPEGALTPDEAALGVWQATQSEALADQAHDLIVACDRTRFGTPSAGAADLRERGRGFFRGLPRRSTEPRAGAGTGAGFEKQ